jgi:hypothetical protein
MDCDAISQQGDARIMHSPLLNLMDPSRDDSDFRILGPLLAPFMVYKGGKDPGMRPAAGELRWMEVLGFPTAGRIQWTIREAIFELN